MAKVSLTDHKHPQWIKSIRKWIKSIKILTQRIETIKKISQWIKSIKHPSMNRKISWILHES